MRARVLIVVCALLVAVPVFAGDALKGPAGSIAIEGRSIEVLSWSFGVSQTAVADGGGSGSGKATFTDFTFTKKLDKTSSSLFLACATGKHFPKATLSVADEKGNVVGTVDLDDVLVTGFTTSARAGDAPTESISLSYSRIQIKY